MKKISINKFNEKQSEIPLNRGIYKFYSEDEILFLDYTENLQERLKDFFDENEVEWKDKITHFSWFKTETKFNSILQKKKLLKKYHPSEQKSVKTWHEFSYIGLNWEESPYVKIAESTMKKDFYIGPFIDKFFIVELRDIIAENHRGILFSEETLTDHNLRFEKDEKKEIKKFLFENYVQKNEFLLKNIKNAINSAEDRLEFEHAEFLKRKFDVLNRYYDFIAMFSKIKNLETSFEEDGNKIYIKNGLIEEIEEDGVVLNFDNFHIEEYRDNEVLAYDKSHIAELTIVYDHLEKIAPEKLKNIKNSNIKKLWLEEKWLKK